MHNPVNATGAREGSVVNTLHTNNRTSVNVPINGRAGDVATFNALAGGGQQGAASLNTQVMGQLLTQLRELVQMLQQFMGGTGAGGNTSSLPQPESGLNSLRSFGPGQLQPQPASLDNPVVDRGIGERVVDRGQGSRVIDRGAQASSAPAGQYNEGNRTLTLDDGTTIKVNRRFEVTVQYQNAETGKTEELNIWGDPHVRFDDDISGGPDRSHITDFWRDRTFVLPNGAELTFNTAPWRNGMTVTAGVDVVHKGEAFQMTGIDSKGLKDLEVTHFADGARFDAANPDGVTTLHSSFTADPNDKGFAQVEKDGSLRAFEGLNKRSELGNEAEITTQGLASPVGASSVSAAGSPANESIMGLFDQLQQLLDMIRQLLESAMTGQGATSASQAGTQADTPADQTSQAPERQFEAVADTRGTTTQNYQDVANRDVHFTEDSGRNTFNLGGENNRFTVDNIGADDTINLHGNAWELDTSTLDDGDPQGVRYVNRETGSEAILRTDDGRSEGFVIDKVNVSRG